MYEDAQGDAEEHDKDAKRTQRPKTNTASLHLAFSRPHHNKNQGIYHSHNETLISSIDDRLISSIITTWKVKG